VKWFDVLVAAPHGEGGSVIAAKESTGFEAACVHEINKTLIWQQMH